MTTRTAHRARAWIALLLCAVLAGPAAAYPLDGFPATGIERLEAFRLSATGTGRPAFLTEGEMLPSDFVRLGLRDRRGFRIPAPDPALSERLRQLVGGDEARYGIALLDWSDPARPRYAAINPDRTQNPGSVGKLMVLLAWFQALADLYPDDLEARRRVLFDAEIEADAFIRNDSHVVPLWTFGMEAVDRRAIREGDRANVWTYLDWMASASSNAAASMLMKHLVLLRHFGKRYPVPDAEADGWLAATPRAELSTIYKRAMLGPLSRNSLDPTRLRQGSFFTRTAKARIPGTNSVATAAELLRYMALLERGELVDAFSSLEIKRLLYLTDKRIRYAAHPDLADAALYFKSGSLYGCKPEKGFSCGKFRGNRMNYMNSVVTVETVDRTPALRYAVVVLSNVLRKDSSALHQRLGADIHRAIGELHR